MKKVERLETRGYTLSVYERIIGEDYVHYVFRVTQDQGKPTIDIDDISSPDKIEVKIQTTAYGSLNIEDTEILINNYKDAMEAAKVIQSRVDYYKS